MEGVVEMKRILVIAAHPDDEVLGMGGTIAKYATQGSEIALLIVTDGSTSQYKDNPNLKDIIIEKKLETQNCADLLGIKKIYYGNLPDMKLDTVPHVEVNEVIGKVILDFSPTAVFTHFSGDVNKDHQCVYKSTLVACRPTPEQCVEKLFLYSVPSSTEWNLQASHTTFFPNWYENIEGDFADIKYKAMNCYKEELREYPHPRSIEYLQNADKAEGNRVGMKIAESFMLVRNLMK